MQHFSIKSVSWRPRSNGNTFSDFSVKYLNSSAFWSFKNCPRLFLICAGKDLVSLEHRMTDKISWNDRINSIKSLNKLTSESYLMLFTICQFFYLITQFMFDPTPAKCWRLFFVLWLKTSVDLIWKFLSFCHIALGNFNEK